MGKKGFSPFAASRVLVACAKRIISVPVGASVRVFFHTNGDTETQRMTTHVYK